MRLQSYTILVVVTMLTLGVRCSKEEKETPEEDKKPPVEEPAPTDFVKPRPPLSDPTKDFVGRGIEDYISQEWDEVFYTYYAFCNASSHTVLINMATKPDLSSVDLAYMLPGKRDIFGYANELFGPAFQWTLLSLQDVGWVEIFYDQKDDFHRRNGIYEYYHDFTQHFDTAHIGDERQWYYEKFADNRARWTYVFTDADYERAKAVSAERKSDPEWID